MRTTKDTKYTPGTVGIVCTDLARYSAFSKSLIRLVVPSGSQIVWAQGTVIAANRNYVIEQMSGEWVFYLDDDMTFGPETLLKLLDRSVDIVQPLTVVRGKPNRPTAYWHRAEENSYSALDWAAIPPSGLLQCDAVGAGLMLIRKHVVDALLMPWFEWGGTGVRTADGPGHMFLGEDLIFCQKARTAGFKVFVDTDVKVGHITPVELIPRLVDGKWTPTFENGATAWT